MAHFLNQWRTLDHQQFRSCHHPEPTESTRARREMRVGRAIIKERHEWRMSAHKHLDVQPHLLENGLNFILRSSNKKCQARSNRQTERAPTRIPSWNRGTAHVAALRAASRFRRLASGCACPCPRHFGSGNLHGAADTHATQAHARAGTQGR